MLDRVKDDVGAFISGVYDVVPHHLLGAFDYYDIEWLICGSSGTGGVSIAGKIQTSFQLLMLQKLFTDLTDRIYFFN